MQLPKWESRGQAVGQFILKLEKDKAVTGVFRGEVVEFWQHWVDGRSTICPGRDQCEICKERDHEGKKIDSRRRFRVNFVTKGADGNLTAYIFEGGKQVLDRLHAINEQVPLDRIWVTLTKTGEKMQTRTGVDPLIGDKAMLTPAAEKQVRVVTLHDLSLDGEKEEESDSAESENEPAVAMAEVTDDGMPF